MLRLLDREFPALTLPAAAANTQTHKEAPEAEGRTIFS